MSFIPEIQDSARIIGKALGCQAWSSAHDQLILADKQEGLCLVYPLADGIPRLISALTQAVETIPFRVLSFKSSKSTSVVTCVSALLNFLAA
jgi:hypothetical protein